MAAPNKTNKHTVLSLEKRIRGLEAGEVSLTERITELEEKLDRMLSGKTGSTPRDEKSIQKVETFNNEEIPAPRDESSMNVMTDADKLRSMQNAIKILPPNYLDKDGRHSITNIQAIVGFPVTTDMMNEVYRNVEHRNGFLVDKETGQRMP